MAEEKKLLEIENLRKYFPVNGIKGPGVQAVQDVSLYIKKGETLGLVGESGCGKTTLGRTILRLYEPTGGKIIYDGETIYDNPLDKDGKPLGKAKAAKMLPYRRKMQIIFQDPSASLDPRMTVGEIIGEAIDIHKLAASKKDRADMIKELLAQVGYIAASIKDIGDTRVGDTVTNAAEPCAEALPGYKKVNPMVYCGIYPADGAKYPDLRDALEKLMLNDASLSFEPETSIALGFGFRCGFLGLLHMEIIQERLEREYNLDLITTAPSVIYKVNLTNGETVFIDNPTNYPDVANIASAEEPIVNAHIYTPSEYVGNIMELCQDRRGVYKDMKYIDETRVDLHYQLPLNEIVYDFFDALKSRTKGYASFDYEMMGYAKSKLVKLDILLNGEVVDALSFIVHEDKAYSRGRRLTEKLKENIPRQLFEIPVQAAIGGKIIARETIKAMRKDVLAKCYGGDITRKKKLLEKQKEGKKRMRQLGSVSVPQEAFMSVLKLDE